MLLCLALPVRGAQTTAFAATNPSLPTITSKSNDSSTNPPSQIFTLRPISTNGLLLENISGRIFAGQAHWAIQCSGSASIGLGVAVGDFYGRGYPQLAIGASRKRAGRGLGSVCFFSFRGAKTPPYLEELWLAEFGWKRFGMELVAGDVNRDGVSDLLSGMPEFVANEDFRRQGLVRLYLGTSNGVSHCHSWQKLGEPMTSAGKKLLLADVNRDGRADALIVATRVAGETNARGNVELFLGTDSGLAPTLAWSVQGESAESLGAGLAVGDVNGDGWPDIILGAPQFAGEDNRAGKVNIYFGSAAGFSPSPNQVLRGFMARSQFGESIAALGDLNGDGCADIVVGAPGIAGTSTGRGEVFLFLGSRTGILKQPVWQARGWREDCLFGKCVAGAGDVNGDGIPDLIVGAPCAPVDTRFSARAALWLGRREGFSKEPDWQVTSESGHTGLGTLAGAAGDLDGDGLDDFFVSSPLDGGRIDVFRGLRQGYGAWERFPADGKVCLPEDRSLLGQIDIRKSEAGAAGARQKAGASGGGLTHAPPVAGNSTLQRTFLGAGVTFITVIVGVFLWLRRRNYRSENESARSERERMARDLHDDLGADVQRLQLLTERLIRTPGDGDEAKALREQVVAMAQNLSGSVDRAVWAVKPENDTLENFVTFLASYAPSVLRPGDIECELNLPAYLPDRALSGDTRQNLVLSVNEILHNVIKHSQAKGVIFRVVWSDPWLEIEIEDNGCGTKVKTARPGGGNGLGNLSARMKAANGSCVITEAKEGGTKVVLRLSLAGPPRKERASVGIQGD